MHFLLFSMQCWWGKESGEGSVPSTGSSGGQGQQGNSSGGGYPMYPYHMYYNYWMAMANQQMAASGQSGQQQTNAQTYMPMVQGQGYPMYGMYSQQYGFVFISFKCMPSLLLFLCFPIFSL